MEGDWAHLEQFLERLGVLRNRFGGFRLYVERWPVDIWGARETWAIREQLIRYRDIGTLTETTILNWDAILLNWRTEEMIYRRDYFSEIRQHLMDIVLPEIPNPLGAAMRAFRHLCSKDAEKLTVPAARYLGNAAKCFSPEAIIRMETSRHRNRVIDPIVLRFFEKLDTRSVPAMRRQFNEVIRSQSKNTLNSLQPLLV